VGGGLNDQGIVLVIGHDVQPSLDPLRVLRFLCPLSFRDGFR